MGDTPMFIFRLSFWDTVKDLSAETAGKAKYLRFLQISDVAPDLTFREFVKRCKFEKIGPAVDRNRFVEGLGLSKDEFEVMQHALGYNYSAESYRNYFYCSNSDKTWEGLVGRGLAVRRGGWASGEAVYHVTDEGMEALHKVMKG